MGGVFDGSGCSILFCASGGKEDNIEYSSPGKQTDKTVRQICDNFDGEILIVDLSVSEDFAEYLNARGKVTLIDHHRSAVGLKKFDWCIIDSTNKQCGSKLFYDYITRTIDNAFKLVRYKELIELIDDHDRWIKKLDKTEDLRYLHHFLGQQKFVKRFINQPAVQFSNTEEKFIKHERDLETDYVDDAFANAIIKNERVGNIDCNVAYVLCDDYQNTVGEKLIKENSVDLVIMIGKRSISIRSSNAIDASHIASINGGGGHLCASGTQLENILGKSLLDLVIQKIKL